MKRLMCAAAAVGLSACFAAPCEEGFKPLFDGKSIDGWTKHGEGGIFSAENGELVARFNPEKPGGSFLAPPGEYENFILRFEFKFDAFGNSGVQFRSQVLTNRLGKTTMGGYQFEMTPDGQNIARIFDQGRSSFKYKNTKAFIWFDCNTPMSRITDARQSFFETGSNAWQKAEVRCEGPRIRTWLNGLPVVDILDGMELKGLFGFQFHAGKEGGVRWRNVRIKELPPNPGWKKLDPANPGVHGDCIVRGVIRGKMPHPSMHWFDKAGYPAEMAVDEQLLWSVPDDQKGMNTIESIFLGDRAVHRVNMIEIYDLNRPRHAARSPLEFRHWRDAAPADVEFEILDL